MKFLPRWTRDPRILRKSGPDHSPCCTWQFYPGSSSTLHNCPRRALIYRQRVPQAAPNYARASMSIGAESSGAAALATEPRVVPGKQAGRCVHKVHLAAALAGLGGDEDGLAATRIASSRVYNREGSRSA